MSENQPFLQELQERSQDKPPKSCGRAFFRSLRNWTFSRRLSAADFSIGDIVTDRWIDEIGTWKTETGRVVGTCWHPRNKRWEYLIDWLDGCSPKWLYPCFDGNLVSNIPCAKLRRVYASH